MAAAKSTSATAGIHGQWGAPTARNGGNDHGSDARANPSDSEDGGRHEEQAEQPGASVAVPASALRIPCKRWAGLEETVYHQRV